MRLEPADVEAIAQRVAQLLSIEPPGSESVRYVDAAHLARVLGVGRDWVYAHARQLGAIRLGGPKGRLRFDLHHVQRTLADREPTDERKAPARRPAPARRTTQEGLELLPYES